MLLHDLAGAAAGKGIATAGKISACQRFGDRGGGGWNIHPLQPDARSRSCGAAQLLKAHPRQRRSARHREHPEHVADPVRHRDHRRQTTRARLANSLRDDLLHFGSGQRKLRRRHEHGARRGWCRRGSGRRCRSAAPAATARGEQQCRARNKRSSARKSHQASRPTARTALPKAVRKACGR